MVRVKTFTSELKILHTMNELNDLDNQVNKFMEENNIKNVISISDSCTADNGATIGIIRALTYEQ